MTALTTIAAQIEAQYRERTRRSRELWETSNNVFPQGVSGAAKYYAPYPVFVAEGAGGHVTDVDGNDYVDLLMGAGSSLLGHSHPAVVAAVRDQIGRLATTLAPTSLEPQYAERLTELMPYLERIRFTNTGSEATRTALRAARAATGRSLFAKFEGNYHGSDDYFLHSSVTRTVAGSPQRPEPVPDSAGIPVEVSSQVLMLPYNDAASSASLIREHAGDLAAVIMEPVAFSTGGAVLADRPFAATVRAVTEENGIVLIFDEVVTSLRLGTNGAPGYLGITPDLSCIGKAIGGGLPLAAMGGRADLMEAVLGPESAKTGTRIFQSGTFTGNPVSLAAGLAVLDVLEREPVLEHINGLGMQLRSDVQGVLDRYGRGHMTGVGSIFQLHFTEDPPGNRRDLLSGDLELLRIALLGICARGILWPPIHPGLVSYGHSRGDVERVVEVVDEVLGFLSQ